MPYKIHDIGPILENFVHPTVMMWNRVEGRPRATKNFDRALKAEVRDALWMLTKQWQMGEFEGDDAGSPVLAKVRLDTTHLTKYKAAAHEAQPFPEDVPLEAQAEQMFLPLNVFGQNISLDLRLMAGRRWKKMLKDAGLLNLVWDFTIDNFPVKLPDPTSVADAAICAHPDTWQQFAAVADRVADGIALYLYLKDGNKLVDLPGGGTIPTEPDEVIEKFVGWFGQFFLQPNDPNDNAWLSSQLEYQFACSAPLKNEELILTAKEYYHGHLDWYNFNLDPSVKTLGDVAEKAPEDVIGKTVQTMLPTPVMFDGMPNTRWWAFESNKINYGFIKPGSQELSKLLFMEFGLVFANDWFLIPYDLKAGSIAKVAGMSVSNVFGENFWIEASGRGLDEDWDRWNMFSVNIEGKANIPSDTSLLMLPTVPKIQESKPVEGITFIRDEMANMVWGIETIIPMAHGDSLSGHSAAAQFHGHLQRLMDQKLAVINAGTEEEIEEAKAAIYYEIMNQVPENWIPFIPVHIAGSVREIQLQRAAMPRILKGDPDKPAKVRPRTSFLTEGLEEKKAYYVFEEEIPRDGAQLYKSYQRTRWKDGSIFIWLGAHKTTGRGEGSSGLAFDRIMAKG